MTRAVNVHKENLCLHGEHQLLFEHQIFVRHLIGTGHHSRHWDTVVNRADETPALTETPKGREENQKEKMKENTFK